MKKFFVIFVIAVLAISAVAVGENWDKFENAVTVQASADNEAAEETEAAEEEEPAPRVALDFDKLYALHAPEDVIMKINGKDVTWDGYFYCLYNQAGRIASTLQQMAMYYGYNSSWDEVVDEEGTMTVADLAVSNSVEMLKQQMAVANMAEEKKLALTEEQKALVKEQVNAYFKQNLGEDVTEEEISELLAGMFLSPEKFEAINMLSALYDLGYIETYGENAENVADEQAIKYLEDDGYLAANHILFLTVDPSTGEALDEDAAVEKKALAEETLAKLKAIEDQDKRNATFAELKAELCEDTGKEAFPDGYLFTPGTMVTEFENAVKALGEHEISDLVESTYGYHIIMRLPLDPDMPIDFNTDGSNVTARTLFAEKEYANGIQSLMDSMEVELVNGYSAPKLEEFVK